MDENLNGYYSLSADVNKAKGRDNSQETATGVVSDFLPELTLTMKDDDLLKLTKKWEKRWQDSTVRSNWIKQCEDNEKYWMGKQYNKLETSTTEALRPLVDNEIFQAVETYLPAATRQNPEPLVEGRSTEKQNDDIQALANIVRNRLADWSDDVRLRLKIKKAGRHWLIYLVGVGKMGWDVKNNRPAIKIIRPKKLILDPDGVTDEDGYSGKFVGEYRKMEAARLIEIIKKQGAKEEVLKKVEDMTKGGEGDAINLGSDVQFIEWWTDEYMCWTLDESVLLKVKNPHWNYEDEVPTEAPAAPSAETPAAGSESSQEPVNPAEASGESKPLDERAEAPAVSPAPIASSTPGMPQVPQLPQAEPAPMPSPAQPPKNTNNHFVSPKKPFVWISIFNLGATPVDVTSLISQNLPQQDLINKRLKQIDKNADGMNGGVVVSEERSGLTKDEAKGVTDALRRGGTVIIPTGAPSDAITRLSNPPLSPDIFNQLMDTRNRMYDIFGIKGITPGGIKNEDTVRGKIITKGLDTDRIGGGITEYFEQFADEVYNWVYQLMLVYDDVMTASNAKLPRLKITVKEGSLLPKDATTKANQAIELAAGGKMSVIDLYKALEYPNPEEMAANLWLEANAPEILFKDNPQVVQAIQMKQQAAQAAGGGKKPPSESINFKDLPPEGKSQMAKQAGIELSPDSAAAHEVAQKTPAVPDQGRSLLNQVPTA